MLKLELLTTLKDYNSKQFLADLSAGAIVVIIVIVAYNMSEWRSFLQIFKSAYNGIKVLLTTFALTVVFDLTIAIQVGMVTNVGIITRELTDDYEESIDINAI